MTGVLFARAQGLHQAGRLEEARSLYEQVLAAEPRHAGALHYLGYLWFQTGDAARALDLIGRAIRLEPNDAGCRFNRALILQQCGRLEDAAEDFRQVAALQPGDAGAWESLGETALALGRAEEALAAYDRALALRPAAELHSGRGVALRLLGRLEDALAAQDRATTAKPGFAEAWSNRGNVLKDLGRPEEALASFDRAMAIAPPTAPMLVNRAILLLDLGRVPEALAGFDRALALSPGDRDAEAAKAMALLTAGDYERGFALYERRLLYPPDTVRGRPAWLGREEIAGKTVLVWAEQGLGDTIQFCRYAPLLAERGARVVLQVQPPLVPLLRGLDGVRVIGSDEPVPTFDLHVPLMSLPRVFGTRLDSIPAPAPLRPDPAKAAAWSARLGPPDRQRVGLVWSGAAGHRNDRHRSLPLERLLAALPEGLDYVSLQKEVRPADLRTLKAHPEVRHFGDELHDFADTAALASLMNVVVSVDTSLAHLAGTLGKDTRLLLAGIGQDWRWLSGRGDTPWYPTMRLYRQGADGGWDGVLG